MGSFDLTLSHAGQVEATVQESGSAVTSLVAASWRRSMIYHGLDPSRCIAPARLTHAELAHARDRCADILEVAKPNLERLFLTAVSAGCCVVLTDADGLILETSSTSADKSYFAEWGLESGALWNEANEGTNGIGTCIAEKRPVVIFKNQHFKAQNIAMSCMGAPIFNQSGKLVAVLDISNCRNDLTYSFAQVLGSLVSESARSMEMDLFRSAFPHARIMIADGHGIGGVSLLAVDDDDVIVGATRLARRILKLDEDSLHQMPLLNDVFGRKPIENSIREAERAEIRRALRRFQGNVSAAARNLGISRATMYRRMHQLDIIDDKW